jgi:hypothetical protein
MFPVKAIKEYEEAEAELILFLALALNGFYWSNSCLCPLRQRMRPTANYS